MFPIFFEQPFSSDLFQVSSDFSSDFSSNGTVSTDRKTSLTTRFLLTQLTYPAGSK